LLRNALRGFRGAVRLAPALSLPEPWFNSLLSVAFKNTAAFQLPPSLLLYWRRLCSIPGFSTALADQFQKPADRALAGPDGPQRF